MDLLLEGSKIGKLFFTAEESVEFQPDFLAVEIAGKIQNPRLYRNAVAADSGTNSHIGDGREAAAVHNSAAGIDAKLRYRDTGGNLKVCSGNPQSSSQLLSMKDLTGEYVGMSQIAGGTFHFTGFNQTDLGRGDPLALQSLFRNDDTGKISLQAESLQFFHVSFAAAAKTEVIAADKAGSTFLDQLLQELIPGS